MNLNKAGIIPIRVAPRENEFSSLTFLLMSGTYFYIERIKNGK
ncbi:hypothetical protein ANASTE_02261 [Anaerofustis stercorihominis DSM 17244]|uniref:Uncharacterized protein n=1 Tax=Anaerofustis stercorihominis DSM 17244 TaxID=445971 RepID=B1C9G8_9FIRM|nr:hypothetical protein ANASTE_02261 [Anaerofustis stercorihominis DSM 17244]